MNEYVYIYIYIYILFIYLFIGWREKNSPREFICYAERAEQIIKCSFFHFPGSNKSIKSFIEWKSYVQPLFNYKVFFFFFLTSNFVWYGIFGKNSHKFSKKWFKSTLEKDKRIQIVPIIIIIIIIIIFKKEITSWRAYSDFFLGMTKIWKNLEPLIL
jgi:hypothetical protein